jgi:N6-L-threonylcarbamoyladenine synthase
VVEDLVERTLAAAEELDVRALLVSGGVAANSLLRKMFREECPVHGIPVFFPSLHLSTDNAAMIAAAAFPKFAAGEFASLEMNAEANFPLGR